MTLSDLASLLDRQLRIHGYHLTDAELRDVASQLAMCLAAESPQPAGGDQSWRPQDKVQP